MKSLLSTRRRASNSNEFRGIYIYLSFNDSYNSKYLLDDAPLVSTSTPISLRRSSRSISSSNLDVIVQTELTNVAKLGGQSKSDKPEEIRLADK